MAAITISFFISACATTPSHRDQKKWEALAASEEFRKEKEVYTSKMNGLTFCWSIGVNSFLADANAKPSPQCIYPASGLWSYLDEQYYGIVKKKVLTQELNQLKVLQVTPDGFVVESPERSYKQVVFIYKTNEVGVIDGAYLDNANWLLYEYAGTYSYKTLLGSKTVQSFRKISRDRLEKAQEGLKSYNPWKEFYITHQLWDHLEAMEKGTSGQ